MIFFIESSSSNKMFEQPRELFGHYSINGAKTERRTMAMSDDRGYPFSFLAVKPYRNTVAIYCRYRVWQILLYSFYRLRTMAKLPEAHIF
ncbi:hypothetical protein DPQ25_02665 [Hydrogeniiclostridium mannosilyticum]|uniref:Uncharacterized protein n=1 Tax=Hydrogeniiclostridium mannosilyticum TaxID=2764322 RepID=A0A328ULR3_9FIRM|nr:hypothetical protein DPQ25_02665 [Hydrogeniiclostridium mannosilyticum]